MRSHFAIIEDEAEFQDNASRVGFTAGVKTTSSSIEFFGHVELSIRLIESSVNLNTDSRTSSGFVILNRDQESQVFAARLGYLGVDFGRYGLLTLGKQWSTYYDVSGITDRFNVFGGTASNTYVGATDGSIGTGRSDQAMIYRNRIGNFNMGVQVLFSNTLNDNFVDGYGASLRYYLTPFMSLGAAFQTAIIRNSLIENTIGFDGDPKYYCFGIRYFKDNLMLAAVYAQQNNGDLTTGDIDEEEFPTVIYDDQGLELAGKYFWNNFRFLGGINFEWPDTAGLPVNEDFVTRDYIFGVEYHSSKLSYLYAEYRVESGYDVQGKSPPDVFTIGLRIDLSHIGEKTMALDD
nr:porin [Robertkochia marina]